MLFLFGIAFDLTAEAVYAVDFVSYDYFKLDFSVSVRVHLLD